MLLPFPSPINSENDNVEKSLNDLILVCIAPRYLTRKNSATNSYFFGIFQTVLGARSLLGAVRFLIQEINFFRQILK